jgi:uncharacterized protein
MRAVVYCWTATLTPQFLIRNKSQLIYQRLLLITHPSHWDYFACWLINDQLEELTKVNSRTIQSFRDKSVIIMSHSAGGITASNLVNEENLYGIICFGYPFKHPEKEDEDNRTNKLKNLQKPLLIIQGTNDEYGGPEAQRKYELSSYVEFEFVEANHEYENLSANDWLRVTNRIRSFLHQN